MPSAFNNYYDVEQEVRKLHHAFRGKIHNNSKGKKAMTRSFTVRLKYLQSLLTAPEDLHSFDVLLLRLGLYNSSHGLENNFYYFSTKIFHRHDKRCKRCTCVLNDYNKANNYSCMYCEQEKK